MEARLYVIPGVARGDAAQLMLEHKGIAYKRTDLLPVVSKGDPARRSASPATPCRR